MNTNTYGARETNGLLEPAAYHMVMRDKTVEWTEPGLRVTRLRLLSDPGFPLWDVSYCHGVLPDGEAVRVSLPFFQLPKRGTAKAIVAYAKADGVYAKALGILDCLSTLQ